MLRQRAVMFEWPMRGPAFGKTVRFFDPIGPFLLKSVDGRFQVRDTRKANAKGGPDNGFWFDSLNEAIAHINKES